MTVHELVYFVCRKRLKKKSRFASSTKPASGQDDTLTTQKAPLKTDEAKPQKTADTQAQTQMMKKKKSNHVKKRRKQSTEEL